MTDFPFAEVARKASILSSQGNAIFQKFTCSACNKRVVSKVPGLFLEVVTCPHCGKQTNVAKQGCNYEFR